MRADVHVRAANALKAHFDRKDRITRARVPRQDLGRVPPAQGGPGHRDSLVDRVRLEARIARHRRTRERDDVRVDADLATLSQPAIGLAYVVSEVDKGAAGRGQNEVE